MNPLKETGVPQDVADRWQQVCSLSEEEMRERSQLIRSQVTAHVRVQERLENGMAFEFDADRREQLEELVALERQCCGPMTIELRETDAGLRLEVLDPPKRTWRSLLRSFGVGAVGSFVLFCVVPLGLAVLLGSAAVAPLLGLDDPWIVTAGAVVFGGALLLFERRRRAPGLEQER